MRRAGGTRAILELPLFKVTVPAGNHVMTG
jgi:hypothetical protein